MVVKSFLKCGISNKADGSEDDYLYNDFEDCTVELEDASDYTTDIEILDETFDMLFDTEESSGSEYEDDDMPDPTFQILGLSEEEEL